MRGRTPGFICERLLNLDSFNQEILRPLLGPQNDGVGRAFRHPEAKWGAFRHPEAKWGVFRHSVRRSEVPFVISLRFAQGRL